MAPYDQKWIEPFSRRIAQLEQDSASLRQEIRRLETDNTILKKSRFQLKGEKVRLQNEKRQLEVENGSLKKENRRLGQDKAGLRKDKRHLEDAKTYLKRENDRYRRGRDAADSRLRSHLDHYQCHRRRRQ